MNGYVEGVEALLAKGADGNVQDPDVDIFFFETWITQLGIYTFTLCNIDRS